MPAVPSRDVHHVSDGLQLLHDAVRSRQIHFRVLQWIRDYGRSAVQAVQGVRRRAVSVARVRRQAVGCVRLQGLHSGRVSRGVLPRAVQRQLKWGVPSVHSLRSWEVQQGVWGQL